MEALSLSLLFTLSVEELLLGSADQYSFLCGGSLPIPGQSDSENFTQTMDSVTIMGFTQEESTCKRGASQIDGEENIYKNSYNTYLTTEQKEVIFHPSVHFQLC